MCIDGLCAGLMEAFVLLSKGLEGRHCAIPLLTFAVIPFAKAADRGVDDIRGVQLKIALEHLIDAGAPDQMVCLGQFDKILCREIQLHAADLAADTVDFSQDQIHVMIALLGGFVDMMDAVHRRAQRGVHFLKGS